MKRLVRALSNLKKALCSHVRGPVKNSDSARCTKCKEWLGGWWCPDSKDGHCEYSEDDVCQDTCLHCGQPDERK